MKKKLLLLFLPGLLLGLGGLVRAQDVPPETHSLLDIYRLAQQRDPVWAAARAQYDAVQERIPQARALFLPSIDATATSSYNDIDIQYEAGTDAFARSGARRYDSSGYGVSLSQPLLRPQNFSIYQASKLQVEQGDLQLRAAQQDLILRVAQTYFNVLLAQDTVALVEAQKEAIQQQWEQAKRGFELGTVTITDANEAQARLDLARAQEIVALNELEVRRQALTQLTGASPQPLAPLKAEIDLQPPAPSELAPWLDAARERNLQLEFSRRAEAISGHEVARNRAGHLPILDLVGSYTDSSADSGTLTAAASDTQAATISLQLQLPLFQGGAQQSRVREALANRERARSELERVRRETELLARQAFLGVANGVAQVRALEQALRSSESALNSNRVGFEVGVRTGIDVLNAQQQLFTAKRDLAQARYNYLLSVLRLNATIARLNEEELVRINALLAQ